MHGTSDIAEGASTDVPVQLHVADPDTWEPVDWLNAWYLQMRKAGADVEVFRYRGAATCSPTRTCPTTTPTPPNAPGRSPWTSWPPSDRSHSAGPARPRSTRVFAWRSAPDLVNVAAGRPEPWPSRELGFARIAMLGTG